MSDISPHNFHIPVLGIGFTIDTPLKVARYGISSVISIADDELIEELRSFHSQQANKEFHPISKKELDYRADRITHYLNLLDELIQEQMQTLKSLDFSEDSDLRKYFELLPEKHLWKQQYREYLATEDQEKKQALEDQLRANVVAGAIDVNIMAKVDNTRYNKDGTPMPEEYSDALSALRGFAQSRLSSSLIISAGYNPRLFKYLANFDDFYPNSQQEIKKKVILKVSDFRSAMTQSKVLAKRGVWVSEYRIESGLNCGGHAFATQGLLLGPILEEFKQNRSLMQEELLELCNKNLSEMNRNVFSQMPPQRVTVQGGIGTAQEQNLLLSYYEMDGTGWGSPFLLVPEATNVDDATLTQLIQAKEEDFYLSNSSPLGVPFHNLRNTSSDRLRKERIAKGRPGSPCYKKFLSSNTEFTETVICTASRQYQHLKIKEIESQDLPADIAQKQIEKVLEKECLCEGLGSAAKAVNNIKDVHKLTAVTICPGPNMVYFSKKMSLQNIINHIYGTEQHNNEIDRPHMFMNELKLYVEYLKNKILECNQPMDEKITKYYTKFKNNLLNGIQYYKEKHDQIVMQATNSLLLKSLELQLQSIRGL